MKTGEFSNAVASVAGGNAILLGVIAAVALVTVPPSGSLGALTMSALKGAEGSEDVIGVVDFGRNDLTVIRHGATAFAAINTAMESLSGVVKYTFPVGVTNKSSSTVDFKDDGGASFLLQLGVGAATPATDFETALAEILSPSVGTYSAAGLVNQIENALTAAGKEGFLVVETNGQTFTLYVVDDTSVATNYLTESATNTLTTVTGSFIGLYHMEPAAAAASSGSFI